MTKALKVTLLTGAALLGVYALLRLGFYLANREYFADAAAGDIAAAFLYGLRFDVAGLILLNAPVLVLLNLPLPTVKPRWYKRSVFSLFALFNVCGFLLNLADFIYYPMVQRRVTFEPFSRPEHLLANVPGWIEEFPLMIFGSLVGLAVMVVFMAVFFRFLDRRLRETRGWVRSHVCGLLLLGACVLGVRGGLQDGIMRPADAFSHSRSLAVGNMTLNSTYTVLLNAFLPRFPPVKKMPQEDAVRIARAMVGERNAEWLDVKHPFLRKAVPQGKPRLRNVVILIQESWTWANIGPDGSGGSRTPFFDEISKEGLLFTNFLASAQRSSEAVPAIAASLPSLFRRPIIGSQVELMRWRGLGDVLGEHGYATTFHHGASPTIEGFRGFTGMIGFDAYYSRDDFASDLPDAETNDGKWGIFDHLFYVDAAKRADAIEGPFASMIFGLAPHDPYRLPASLEHEYRGLPTETPAQRYERSLRYSDFALKTYFDYARTRRWFKNTLFLITADHTRFAPPGSFYESFHVPLLIYAPRIVEPGVRSHIGSHVDILPTIVDLLQLPTSHASMGRSLLDEGAPRYAVAQRSGRYVIFDDGFALMNDLRSDVGLFAYREDPNFQQDLAEVNPDRTSELRTRLFAYLQAVTTSIIEDRVWPKHVNAETPGGR